MREREKERQRWCFALRKKAQPTLNVQIGISLFFFTSLVVSVKHHFRSAIIRFRCVRMHLPCSVLLFVSLSFISRLIPLQTLLSHISLAKKYHFQRESPSFVLCLSRCTHIHFVSAFLQTSSFSLFLFFLR